MACIWDNFTKKSLEILDNLQRARKAIKNDFDILLAGGQDHLKGKIFRVGHLGYINDRDIITVIAAIGNTLVEQNIVSTDTAGKALKIASCHL